MNFLIDECLHGSLVELAAYRGHEATHVNYRGLSGVQDWNLMPAIRTGGFTFVTNNARDFRRLYAAEEIHAGLVIILPNAGPPLQRQLFDAVLTSLAGRDDLVDAIVEVSLVETGADVVLYERRWD